MTKTRFLLASLIIFCLLLLMIIIIQLNKHYQETIRHKQNKINIVNMINQNIRFIELEYQIIIKLSQNDDYSEETGKQIQNYIEQKSVIIDDFQKIINKMNNQRSNNNFANELRSYNQILDKWAILNNMHNQIINDIK